MSTIFRCKNAVASFNKHSATLRANALSQGMIVTKEWSVNGCECFHAVGDQTKVELALSMAECGACVNVNPRVWFTGKGGRLEESVFVQKKEK